MVPTVEQNNNQVKRAAFLAGIVLLVPELMRAQSTVTAASVNGVLNPTQFAGSDIGAQINTAWQSGRTARIPSGTYSLSVSICTETITRQMLSISRIVKYRPTPGGALSQIKGACACTQNLGNVYSDNVLKGNGTGDLMVNWDYGASVTGNYFESSGVGVNLGPTQNVWSTTVERNYFTAGSPESIEIGYGVGFNIFYNTILQSNSSTCFINVTTCPNGGQRGVRGVGTSFAPNEKAEFCSNGTPTTAP